MGILNVTPDSFSDAGRFVTTDAAINAGLRMADDGADIIDVGGESTRPGAESVSDAEEQRRTLRVVESLAAAGCIVSIDTRHASTMQAALDAGAVIVNDVSGLTHDPRARHLVAAADCAVVLMHMRGTPETMNGLAQYRDVIAEVREELSSVLSEALAAGIDPGRVVLDPGIGFAKFGPESVALLRGLPTLAELGYPLLIGVSRKSFIGQISQQPDATQRLGGSLAAGLFALSRGAAILRVHDVAETVQAIRIWQTLCE
jgi:dihydropteroate synthase